jgi:hypothetical protein
MIYKWGAASVRSLIQTSGTATIDHLENQSNVVTIATTAAGTLTTGYSHSAELISAATGYTVTDYQGLFVSVAHAGPGGTLKGALFSVANNGTLIWTSATGISLSVSNTSTGTITTVQGIILNANVNSGGGTVTNSAGLVAARQTVGATANASILIGASFGGMGAFPYGIYQQSTDPNNFNGGLRIAGITTASGANEDALDLETVFDSSATASGISLNVTFRTAAAVFAMTNGYGVLIQAPVLGAGSTVGTKYGLRVANQGSASVTTAIGGAFDHQVNATSTNISLLIGANSQPGGTWGLFQQSADNNCLLGSLAIGSNTAAVGTGALAVEGLLARYQAVATAGWGLPAIYAAGRPAQQVNTTVTLASYVVGAADGSFEVSANINVTVSTTVAMTVTCTYTDEANVARTLTLQFSLLGGTWASSITTAQGNIPYESPVYHIRAKATTTISIQTAGTVTAVTYTGEAIIKQTR